jgi:hypothetical protein
MLRLAWLLPLMASCSFSVPSVPGAQQACIDWFEACRDKAISCGDDPAMAQQVSTKAIDDLCPKVIWSSNEVYDKCIPYVLSASCADSKQATCGGYAHL